MGCSGSANNTKKPAQQNNNNNPGNQPVPPKGTKVFKLEQATLDLALQTDKNKKSSKLTLDLQYKENHRKFVEKLTEAGKTWERLPDCTAIDILLSDKPNDPVNKKLVEIIKSNFPANVQRVTIKSLAKKPESLTQYIDAILFAKTNITVEFCSKNLAVDAATFSTVLQTCAATKRVVFFGTTFSGLDKVAINATPKYTTEEVQFSYCKNLNDKASHLSHVIAAFGKNANLTASIKTITAEHNKIATADELKKSLTAAKMEKVKLVYKEATKKGKGEKGSDSDAADESEASEEDEDEDENDEDDEDESDEE